MNINQRKLLTGVLFLLFCYSSISYAALTGLTPGYPRFIGNETLVSNSEDGDDRSFFRAFNLNSRVFFQDAPDAQSQRVGNPLNFAFAELDVSDPSNPTVIDGEFQVWGNLLGSPSFSLLFSAGLEAVGWNSKTIEFVMDGDQSGHVCDLGFCSFSQELLRFNLLSGSFDGDFSEEFGFLATTIATVPIPAAVWLFGSGIIGLLVVCRRQPVIT